MAQFLAIVLDCESSGRSLIFKVNNKDRNTHTNKALAIKYTRKEDTSINSQPYKNTKNQFAQEIKFTEEIANLNIQLRLKTGLK